MKQVPITTSTGIKMGSRWNESPKPMRIEDPDMIEIQGWLLHDSRWHRQKRIEKIFYRVSTVVALIVVILMMVTK